MRGRGLLTTDIVNRSPSEESVDSTSRLKVLVLGFIVLDLLRHSLLILYFLIRQSKDESIYEKWGHHQLDYGFHRKFLAALCQGCLL